MRHILNLNNGWAFLKDWKAAPVAIPEAAEAVNLPHCWNAVDGQDGGKDLIHLFGILRCKVQTCRPQP